MTLYKVTVMIKVYDFYCPNCGWEDEVFTDSGSSGISCPECASVAMARVPAPRVSWIKMGVDSDFPSASKKWEDSKKDRKVWETKYARTNGDTGEL